MNITVKDLSYRIQDKPLIASISLDIQEGELVGLIGPNGSGKSTLLKNMYRVLAPDQGEVFMNDKDLSRMSHKESARHVAVVSQETSVAFDFTVQEIVFMGRSPHKKMFDTDTSQDREIVHQALSRVGLLHRARSSFSTLSGGEKQRVLIARAVAQQASCLILDEPTNHLDIRYQLQIMDLVKTLKITSLAALHDLNIAAYYCDRLYVLKAGRIIASGSPEQVLRQDLLQDVFEVATEINRHPLTGKPSITFLPEMVVRS
ncbi:heme ABC transporter ATP-binding protein [Paenibacillus lycopersici]|uniref:Heme ABC transporter ATP-binding protein n=1 Tax=Paenibacillus lycopersici TaxID=2704462 RepID=A0A6C0FZW8_9BACL|nr:heme ABC transporter ATP-binding protein [Paenibacillus lycopersici]QHT61073.1 heme ABC transporter ATP-binding protein [Paenibacillus lycopersici]